MLKGPFVTISVSDFKGLPTFPMSDKNPSNCICCLLLKSLLSLVSGHPGEFRWTFVSSSQTGLCLRAVSPCILASFAGWMMRAQILTCKPHLPRHTSLYVLHAVLTLMCKIDYVTRFRNSAHHFSTCLPACLPAYNPQVSRSGCTTTSRRLFLFQTQSAGW